jgi:hypothetical protein
MIICIIQGNNKDCLSEWLWLIKTFKLEIIPLYIIKFKDMSNPQVFFDISIDCKYYY